MFIRLKKRKNPSGKSYTYAYLVKNKRHKKTVEQKIIKYLGRVFKFPKTKPTTLKKYFSLPNLKEYFNKTKLPTILLNFIELELYKHNFKQIKKHLWLNSGCIVNLSKLKLYTTKNKPFVLQLNQGFLTEHTIKNILNFKFPKQNTEDIETELNHARSLANTLLSAGIKPSKIEFIYLFQQFKKVQKTT